MFGAFGYPALTNSKYCGVRLSGVRLWDLSSICLEEKNPDCRLRPPNPSYSVKEVKLLIQSGGWLRSSHPLKKA
jgi:hypothetical protein